MSVKNGPAADGRHTVDALIAYWESLRHGSQVPQRSAIDPRRIEAFLADAFIIERVSPREARFRIAGQTLSDLMGMEVRGMPVTSFFLPAARDEAGIALGEVFDGPEAVEMDLAGEAGPRARPGPRATMLFLPLRSDLGDISRALGCLVATTGPVCVPQRFAIRDIVATPAIAGRPLARWGDAPPRPALATELAETAIAFRSAPRRGHLRLVKSD